uniref:AbiV family abortive infection protein n=1 Tax=Pararhizobium sp. IMCC3301 TaxID=3067904 RepID=UPI0027409AB9|nr:AbiV family abortive infection protein [Pararhizobium sp. IMCC3301]
MGSPHLPKLTTTLLHLYSEAALRNADELLVESLLLRDHDHMARAYFLAVSCIEEAGKALLTFDSQHRNLTDPAVCKKLKASMENHGQKINYALSIWAFSSPDPREALRVALDLTFHLKNGREPSMYSDLRNDPERVQTPREIVRATAARDCVRLAENCLALAHRHVSEKIPAKFTTAHDRLFTMKPGKFQEMLSAEDFWWYYISRMEAGQQDIAEAVLGYERDHIKTGTPFRPA